MITITMAGQILNNADGTPANGEIRLTPALPFEYDGASGRTMVLASSIILRIKNGVLVDAADNPSNYAVAPTSGAGNDVSNNYYHAAWVMNGAPTLVQKWNITASPSTVDLLAIQLISAPALPVVTVPGATGAAGAAGQSVHHTSLTAGTGAAGTTDTYTFWGDAGETISLGTYLVSNGANGSAGAGALQAANNLSDVQSAQTSLTNIGGLGNTSLINGGGF